MDWHKLQHKLFAMDPVDPRAELERLRKVAQTPTPLEAPDLIKESFEIKPGSMPLGIDSISDFATLAGIRLDEKQLKGSAGQAKGSDPVPSAKAGRTKHPLKDKLVGEAGALDRFNYGRANYNNINPFKDPYSFSKGSFARSSVQNTSPNSKNPKPSIAGNAEQVARILKIQNIPLFSAAIVSASQGNPLSDNEKKILGQAFQNMLLLDKNKKSLVFRELLDLQPQQPAVAGNPTTPTTQNPSTPSTPSTSPTTPPATNTSTKRRRTKSTSTNTQTTGTPPTVNSSKSFDSSKQTIKEHLLRLLEEKKLK